MATNLRVQRRPLRLTALLVMFVAGPTIAGDPPPKPPDEAQQRIHLEQVKAELLRQAAQELRANVQQQQARQLRGQAAGIVTSDDDFDDIPADNPAPAPAAIKPPQAKAGAAASAFVQTVFGGFQGDIFGAAGNQLEFLLQARLASADLVCSLTEAQKRKLQLAGRGDIKRLIDQIRDLQRRCERLDDAQWNDAAADIFREAKSLRELLEAGPFGTESKYMKSFGRVLTPGQLAQCERYLAIERLGGRIHLRPRGDDEIKAIRMTKATLTDEGLGPLAGFTGLQSLNLDYTQVTDAGMGHLAGLTGLEILEMEGTQVRGPGLRHLRRMQLLQMLDLRRTRVDDAALVHLKGLVSLKVLQLAHTAVSGSGFEQLSDLPHLDTLLLVQAPVTDEGLAGLVGLKRLREINLEGTQVTDAGLPHLAQLTNLVTLDLRRTQVTDAGLVHLRSLKKVQALYLYGTQVTAKGAEEFERQMPDTRVVR